MSIWCPKCDLEPVYIGAIRADCRGAIRIEDRNLAHVQAKRCSHGVERWGAMHTLERARSGGATDHLSFRAHPGEVLPICLLDATARQIEQPLEGSRIGRVDCIECTDILFKGRLRGGEGFFFRGEGRGRRGRRSRSRRAARECHGNGDHRESAEATGHGERRSRRDHPVTVARSASGPGELSTGRCPSESDSCSIRTSDSLNRHSWRACACPRDEKTKIQLL